MALGDFGAGRRINPYDNFGPDQRPNDGPQFDPGVQPAAPGFGTGAPPPPPAGATVAPFNYQTPAYTGPMTPQYDLPGVPQFNAPQFHAPDYQALLRDPSYQFRLKQGEGALQASAAAKGVLRTGMTLKDILGYGQDYASQEAQNAFNRAKDTYGLNYKRAYDQFAPQFADYNNRFSAAVGAGNLGFGQQWNQYQTQLDDEFRREQLVAGLAPPQ